MYFRVEDENGLSPNLRSYGWDDSYSTKVSTYDADKLIANEIREEVNNSNQRKVFSCSKSLAVTLFKYNYIADNPIHLIPYETSNCVEFDIVDEYGKANLSCAPYSIGDLEYPIKRYLGDKEIILKNYIIEVDNDTLLDKYLKKYTGTGKKKFAACEKDNEVIIRHVIEDYVIYEHISSVYILYALQYKTKFLNCDLVFNELMQLFSKKINEENERIAFFYLIDYLKKCWRNEEEISNKILEEKRKEGRIMCGYDAYYIAFDIIEGDYDLAWNSLDYCLDNLLEYIWEIFNKWRYSNKIMLNAYSKVDN